jgi:hypothetical protein
MRKACADMPMAGLHYFCKSMRNMRTWPPVPQFRGEGELKMVVRSTRGTAPLDTSPEKQSQFGPATSGPSEIDGHGSCQTSGFWAAKSIFLRERHQEREKRAVCGRTHPLQNVPETWFTTPGWINPARSCRCHGRNGRSWKNACGLY